MPTNRDIADFYELRHGLQGMADFVDATTRFLDRHGIAVMRATARKATNGNGHNVDTAREHIKRKYVKRLAARTEATDAAPMPMPMPQRETYSSKREQQRAVSARILEALDLVEPRPVLEEGRRNIGALVRRGYAKKKGDGYVRTKKQFHATDVAQQQAPPTPPTAAADDTGSDSHNTVTVPAAAEMIGVSDSYVRLLIKQKKLDARREMRVPKGGIRPMSMLTVDRDEVARYKANNM